ncbi:MAG: hypothetical protein HS104_24280 [Polyangiaceae bacterium]|nr:hypothetical protein [Polyangiaceae bacterium]MCL4754299.1 hypothetical protein [Myxococcales bacterium]
MSREVTSPPSASRNGAEERWGVATTLLLPAVEAARRHVGIDEATFRTHTFHRMPREFFLWTALDEVLKACVFLMKLDGFLADDEPRSAEADDIDCIERAIEAVLLEEERLRTRRLCELLVQLVLFSRKDTPEVYKHFLLLEELVRAAAFNQELAEFHGMPSAWIGATIEMTVEEARKVESLVDASDAWYARASARPARADDWQRTLTSARQRVVRALPLMTDFERLAIGTTYGEAFGSPSESIHFRAGADSVDHSRDSTVVVEGTKLGLMGLCVMRRVHELLGRPPVPPLTQIATVLDSNQEPTRLMESLNFRAAVSVGDFVLARGYLGQVVDETVSDFGYRSVRVELLAERPLPGLAADWFRVRDVVRLFSKPNLVARVRAALGDPAAAVDDEALRSAALSAWELGLRADVGSRSRRRAKT